MILKAISAMPGQVWHIYVNSKLFVRGNFRTRLSSLIPSFLLAKRWLSYSFILCVALASGGAALSLVPHDGLWRFLPHLCWAYTLVCL